MLRDNHVTGKVKSDSELGAEAETVLSSKHSHVRKPQKLQVWPKNVKLFYSGLRLIDSCLMVGSASINKKSQ